MPWKRLVSLDFLREIAPKGRMVFLKDTCCDCMLIRERLKAVEGTPLKIFNANAQSWFDSYCHGSAGYNGVMANFHPDLYNFISGALTTRIPIPKRPVLSQTFLLRQR